MSAPRPRPLTKARRIAMIGDINLPQCRKYRVEQLAELWAGQGVDYGYCSRRRRAPRRGAAAGRDAPDAVPHAQCATDVDVSCRGAAAALAGALRSRRSAVLDPGLRDLCQHGRPATRAEGAFPVRGAEVPGCDEPGRHRHDVDARAGRPRPPADRAPGACAAQLCRCRHAGRRRHGAGHAPRIRVRPSPSPSPAARRGTRWISA